MAASSSSSLRKMGEEKGENFNGGDSDSSGFDAIDSFPVPQPKRRMNMNVLQVMAERNVHGGHGRKLRKWEVPARLVSRKFRMVMSSVFGSRESSEKSRSKPGDVGKNSQREVDVEKGGKSLKQRIMMMPQLRQKKSSSFRSFFSKKTGLKLLRSKILSGGSSHERSRIVKIAMLKEAGPVNLAKVLRRRRSRSRSRRTAPKPGGGEEKRDTEGEADGLCKKRILMGGKCRPLSLSDIYIYSDIQRAGEENVGTEGEEDAELCKKGILIGGGQGRPLKSSYDLRYSNAPIEGEGDEEKEDTEGEKCRPLRASCSHLYSNARVGGGEEEEKDSEGEDAELRKMEEKCRLLNSTDTLQYLNVRRKGDEQEEDTVREEAEQCKKRSQMGEKCRPPESSHNLQYPNALIGGGGEGEGEGEGGGEGDEEKEDAELCKKRILMGEKCRPLNSSGFLNYDKNGMLLPDLALP